MLFVAPHPSAAGTSFETTAAPSTGRTSGPPSTGLVPASAPPPSIGTKRPPSRQAYPPSLAALPSRSRGLIEVTHALARRTQTPHSAALRMTKPAQHEPCRAIEGATADPTIEP